MILMTLGRWPCCWACLNQGNTLITSDGKEVQCQLVWKDRKAFDAFLVKTLTQSPKAKPFAKPDLVQDLVIEQTGGDGIYLGAGPKQAPNRQVTIRRVDCNVNHRQGISVISAEDLLIEDCRLRQADGTDPKAGIDFEPNHPADSLVNCVVRRCTAEFNAGTGFQICPQYLNSSR